MGIFYNSLENEVQQEIAATLLNVPNLEVIFVLGERSPQSVFQLAETLGQWPRPIDQNRLKENLGVLQDAGLVQTSGDQVGLTFLGIEMSRVRWDQLR